MAATTEKDGSTLDDAEEQVTLVHPASNVHSKELPRAWVQCVDTNTQRVYYFNRDSRSVYVYFVSAP